MRPLSPLVIASLLALCACSRGAETEETATADDACGDIDGPDGPVPNILGNWTADFGQKSFEENCGFSGLTAGSDYLLDGALEIDGRIPDQIWVTFDEDPTAEFWGVVSPTGAVSFSGTYEHREGLMDFAFGGKAYYDEYRQRTFIEGFAWVGIDTNDDPESYECTARGEWSASKSGL